MVKETVLRSVVKTRGFNPHHLHEYSFGRIIVRPLSSVDQRSANAEGAARPLSSLGRACGC